MPPVVPTVPPPADVPDDDLDQPLIRVLLDRFDEEVVFEDPGRAWRITANGAAFWMWGPLTLRPVEGAVGYQVGAFGTVDAAEKARESLRGRLGSGVDVQAVTGPDGLTRVRVYWSEDGPAAPEVVLERTGFPGAFPVADGGGVRITGRGGPVESKMEILLEPSGRRPAAIGTRRYRGRFRVRPSQDGQGLLINELNLERYLFGVVPAEMGPAVFPQLDALKAQAVAARTYAVAHLGDHQDEGYDICDTPACQVYAGASAEHPLSTRAVEETSGLIAVFDGRPIDAMYTSTCGGHTEDAAELFSGRAQPYLKGVPCRWDRDLVIEGTGEDGKWMTLTEFEAFLAHTLLGFDRDASPADIVKAVNGATASPVIPLGEPEAFARALLDAAGLRRAAEILAPGESALKDLLFLADLYRVPLDPPFDGAAVWPAAAALAVLEIRGDIDRDHGEAVPRPDGVGIFPRRAAASEALPDAVPLWERWREGYRRRAEITVRPGTELQRFRRGDEVVALIVRRSGGAGEADRRSAWREWIREKPWDELALRLGVPDLEKLEITRRTSSGRVVGLAAVGRSGVRKQWTGFDVRRALDLPETLFTVSIITRPDGAKVARFLGRGWGHGVGLCQNGAYGLARSGMTFDRILEHYYTGIRLVDDRELVLGR